MIFMEIRSLFSGHGFGINTNILETNVINLAVVIAIVITFVGDAFRELLENRKKTVLDNLSLADARAQEMEDKINQAKKQLQNAQHRANEIQKQGILAAEQEKKLCIAQAKDEANRLKQLKEDRLRFQQQKAIQQISQQIVALSVNQAQQSLEKRMKSRTFQPWVNKGKIAQYVQLIQTTPNLF